MMNSIKTFLCTISYIWTTFLSNRLSWSKFKSVFDDPKPRIITSKIFISFCESIIDRMLVSWAIATQTLIFFSFLLMFYNISAVTQVLQISMLVSQSKMNTMMHQKGLTLPATATHSLDIKQHCYFLWWYFDSWNAK